MLYRLADLVERSGLPARTIRSYIDDGYLPKADGRGSGAVYTEEHLLKAIAIARMRARGDGWDAVDEKTRDASVRRLRALVRDLEPAEAAATPLVPTAPSPAAPSAGRVSSSAGSVRVVSVPVPELSAAASASKRDGVSRPASAADSTTLGSAGMGIEPRVESALRGGTELVMAEILPGLSLLLRRDAAPLVRRVAAEILEKYAKG
jgi:hypothetical protein